MKPPRNEKPGPDQAAALREVMEIHAEWETLLSKETTSLRIDAETLPHLLNTTQHP